MIWVILAAVGVPLWLCAIAVLTLVVRNRALRARPGNVAVRVRPEGKRRWYGLRAEPLAEVADWLEPYRRHWSDRLDALEQHLEDNPT